jgi:hypothetical protein
LTSARHGVGAAYGLRARSAIPLPELPRSRGRPDIDIRLGPVAAPPATITLDRLTRVAGTGRDTVFLRDGVGAFRLRDGEEITADPARGADPRVVRAHILGPMIALLLHQRGRLVLHASAVNVSGRAVAFLGGSGWGKSTIAAALYRRGHALVTDDVLVLELGPDGAVAFPGIPQLKLWPDALRALGDDPTLLPSLHGGTAKRSRAARRRFTGLPIPLGRIYILAGRGRPSTPRLHARQATVELIRHTYTARLLGHLDPVPHLRLCAALANMLPVARLGVPRSLARLDDVARTVEEDVGAP